MYFNRKLGGYSWLGREKYTRGELMKALDELIRALTIMENR
jgi:hypothetical protein